MLLLISAFISIFVWWLKATNPIHELWLDSLNHHRWKTLGVHSIFTMGIILVLYSFHTIWLGVISKDSLGRTCGRLPWPRKAPFYWTHGTPSPQSGHVPSARNTQSGPNSQWPAASCSSKNAWCVPNRIPDRLPRAIILLPTKSTLDGTSPCPFRWPATLYIAPPAEWDDKQDARSPHQRSLSAA